MSSVRIRLARTAGRKFHPIYRIRVQAGRAGRDGKYIEEIGTYYPITESRADRPERLKVVKLDHQRAKYWLSVGAQPTDAVARLLAAADLVPKPPVRDSTKTKAAAAAKAAEEAEDE